MRGWQAFAHDAPAFRDYVLHSRTWLAEYESRAVGFGGVAASGEVRSLYVHADKVRCGWGSALLASGMTDARSRGIDRLVAWAIPFSLPVFGCAGFVLLGTVRAPFQGVMFDRHGVARDRIGLGSRS